MLKIKNRSKNGKKENKKKATLYKRAETQIEEVDSNQGFELRNYNGLKEHLEFNLKLDIDIKIQRMKIIHEIKQKNLYKYDGFYSFEQFNKSYVISKSQAYIYKFIRKFSRGILSIEKVKEMGLSVVYKNIIKKQIVICI
ncbi:chromosome replication/partitioning protein (plasmid) [Borrelia sp. CA_690]|uniref:chromosome replication/partitioning protein n=1 Tax=Borrelia TaxID=138 RepID=UPI001E4D7FAC|nr:chromosome replication/partitioning protein [Borrelia maritima]